MVVQHIIRTRTTIGSTGTKILPLRRRVVPRSSCSCLPWSAVVGSVVGCGGWHGNGRASRPFSSTSAVISPRNASPSASSSVSVEEVAHFDTLASTWWDAERNPLIGMNPTRVSYIVETLRTTTSGAGAGAGGGSMICDDGNNSSSSPTAPPHRPLHGLRALDVGCGGGLLSESLARLGASVCAVDPSFQVAKAAREHSQHHPLTKTIDYRGGTSVEELARELTAIGDDDDSVHVATDNTNTSAHLFDLVCVLEVVEHATDPQKLLDSACRLLRPGVAVCIHTEPNCQVLHPGHSRRGAYYADGTGWNAQMGEVPVSGRSERDDNFIEGGKDGGGGRLRHGAEASVHRHELDIGSE